MIFKYTEAIKKKSLIVFFILMIVYPGYAQNTDTLHEEAISKARHGEFSRALELINSAHQQQPLDKNIQADLIVILSWANRHEQAIKEFEKFFEQEKAPDYLLLEIARSYRISGYLAKAIEIYKAYLVKNPDDQTAKSGLVYTYFEAHKMEDLYIFINQYPDDDPEKLGWVLIESLQQVKRSEGQDNARALLEQALEYFGESIPPRLAVAKILMKAGDFGFAEKVLKEILDKDPLHMDALFVRAELYEAQAEFLEAYRIYDKLLKIYPSLDVAKNLKYRALLNLGCNRLVADMIERSEDNVDEDIYGLLFSNKAVDRISWLEYEKALEQLEKNRQAIKDARPLSKQKIASDLFLRRTLYDKTMTLRKLEQMKKVKQDYEFYQQLELNIPPWIMLAAADAYLYLQEPEKAYKMYRDVYEGQKDGSGNIRLSIYSSLIELGEYEQGLSLLDELDSQMPVMVKDRGFLEENWKKVDINISRGWNLMYQDKLKAAQRYLEQLLLKAPFNTNIRNALAHVYLWRGWPRKALEEFQIIRTIDPKNVPAAAGYCYALNENNYPKKAREKAAKLLKRFAKNKHIQKLNRSFEIQDMSTLTAGAGFTAENKGVDEFSWYAQWDEPISSWKNIFVRFDHRRVEQSQLTDSFDRIKAGIDFRLSRDWYLLSALSMDISGEDNGFVNRLKWQANDHISLTALYDTYSLAVPSRARVKGVDGKDLSFSFVCRQSEELIARLTAGRLDLSDNNSLSSYLLYLDKALMTEAYWKIRIGLEGYIGDYKDTDVDYFSPDSIYSIYIIPMVEHVWFRSYDKAWVDRFYLGLGRQWQKSFSSAGIWYVRYEQDHALNELFSVLVGTTYSHNVYDADKINSWSVDIEIKRHF